MKKTLNPTQRRSAVLLICFGVLGGFLAGWFISPKNSSDSQNSVVQPPQAAIPLLWTCSMHPQIQQHKEGKCPLCFMDLIPVTGTSSKNASNLNSQSISLSAEARTLASIETAPAIRRSLSTRVRLSGKVAINENRREVISARVDGRIDRLFIASEGISVRKNGLKPGRVNLLQEPSI